MQTHNTTSHSRSPAVIDVLFPLSVQTTQRSEKNMFVNCLRTRIPAQMHHSIQIKTSMIRSSFQIWPPDNRPNFYCFRNYTFPITRHNFAMVDALSVNILTIRTNCTLISAASSTKAHTVILTNDSKSTQQVAATMKPHHPIVTFNSLPPTNIYSTQVPLSVVVTSLNTQSACTITYKLP